MNGKVSAAAIRGWLKAQKRPCTLAKVTAARAADPDVIVGASPAEISAGLGIPVGPEGLPERMRVYWSLRQMFKDEILDREGVGRGLRYFVIREPVKVLLTPAERRQRRNARLRATHVSKGGRTIAEVLELRSAQAAERRAARKAATAQRKADREAALRARRAAEAKQRAKPKRKPKAKRKPKPVIAKPVKPVKVQPVARKAAKPDLQPVLQSMESVEAFKARGGQVEKLPPPWERAA